MHRMLGDHLAQFAASLELAQLVGDERHHRLERLGRHVDAAETLGDRHDAHRQ